MSSKRKRCTGDNYNIPLDAIDGTATDVYADGLSRDGRRVLRDVHPCYVPPTQDQGFDYNDPFLGGGGGLYTMPDDDEDIIIQPIPPQGQTQPDDETGARRFATLVCPIYLHTALTHLFMQTHDPVLDEWKEFQQLYLHELLRHDGTCGANVNKCPRCPSGVTSPAVYRCMDCTGTSLMCRACIVNEHSSNPWHFIRVRVSISLVFLS